jgi:hypothetical protein
LATVTFTPTSTLATIGIGAFASIGITSIIIPNSVISIGNNAFFQCQLFATATISTVTANTLGISGTPILFFGKPNVNMIYTP